jgi:hypothetical protein
MIRPANSRHTHLNLLNRYMNAYALNRREKTGSGTVPKCHRKRLARLKVKDRRDLRKVDRKALRDEWDF